jgi:hypothetical protein
MHSSNAPTPGGSSSGPPCRCGLQKYSNTNSAASKLNSEQRGHFAKSRPGVIGTTHLPER